MTNVSDIMTSDVQIVEPQDSLRRAAELMQEHDVGALPVCDGDRLLGMLTDRDITVRCVAQGLDADATTVSDIMSDEVVCATADQDTEELMRLMGDEQLRRIPVVDSERNLIGIVSLADLALRQSAHIDGTVRDISEPGLDAKNLK